MTFSNTYVLRDVNTARSAWTIIKNNWAAMAHLGKPLEVVVREYKRNRNLEQNALLHALLTDIANKAWVRGRQYDMEIWKEHFRREFIGTEEITLPSGQVIVQGKPTSKLGVSEFADLVTQIQAYAAQELGLNLEGVWNDRHNHRAG